MKKKCYTLLAALALVFLSGCGGKEETTTAADPGSSTTGAVTEGVTEQETDVASTEAATEAPAAALSDGVYYAKFDTDGSMFHVNEMMEGKGVLTVADGKMTIHITMPSKNIVNLYYGLAEDAKKEGAELILPVTEQVVYTDGTTEDVYAFDVPVPALDVEYDVALVGTKGKWYDHKVKVSSPEPGKEAGTGTATVADGTYTIEASVEGGTGRASITSPAKVTVKDGAITVQLEWSSPHYDYMIVDGEKYLPVNTEGNSVFEIPVKEIGQDMTVIADTTAMSQPHEIEYVLHLKPETLK